MGNYAITDQATATADITAKAVTVSYTSAGKVYDGNTTAPVTVTATGIVPGDTVSISEIATFDSKNVGTNKTVSITGISLSGGDAQNYGLQDMTDTLVADITRRASVTWVGSTIGDWFDPTNWEDGAVPDLNNVASVNIPTGVIVTFDDTSATGSAQAGPVDIDSLGIAGDLQMSTGTLAVGSGGIALNKINQTGGALSSLGSMMLACFTQSGGTTSTSGDFTTDIFDQTGGEVSVGGDMVVREDYSQNGSGTVTVTGRVTLTDNNGGLVLGNLNSGGNLSVTSTDGPITQTPNTSVIAHDTSQFNATNDGQPADILLDNPGNDFTGVVDLDGANISVTDGDGGMVVGDINASGHVSVEGSTNFRQQDEQLDTAIDAASSQVTRGVDPQTGSAPTLPANQPQILEVPIQNGSAPEMTPQDLQGSEPANSTNGQNSGSNAITIEINRQPTPQDPGLITVFVPQEIITSSQSLVIEFPEAIRQEFEGADGRFTRMDGSPLPSWVDYAANPPRFILNDAPLNQLPLQVIGEFQGRQLMMVITTNSTR